MRAVVQHRYGPPDQVLSVAEVPTPTPGPGEVVVAVEAASVNAADWHLVAADPVFVRLSGYGVFRPRRAVPGSDLAGVVAAVGPDTTRHTVGDRVFGWARGTFAEYAVTAEAHLATIPDGVPTAVAASVPLAGTTALQGLRDHGRTAPGDRVLVVGAGGGVGQFAVQVAVALGAEVTAVVSTRNLAMAQGLGAAHVVDHTTTSLADLDGPFDVVLAVNGNHRLADVIGAMAPDGRYVIIGADRGGRLFGPLAHMLRQMARGRRASQTVAQFTAGMTPDDLGVLAGFLGDGRLTAVVDHTVGLDGAPGAVAHLMAGHARAKVVVEPGR